MKAESFDSVPQQLGNCYDNKTILAVFDTGVFNLINLETGLKKDYFTRKTPFTYGIYFGDGKTFAFSTIDSTIEFYTTK